jgi:hypothetical protein
MINRSTRVIRSFVLTGLLTSLSLFAADPTPLLPQPPRTVSVPQVSDWGPYLADIQSSEKSKQDSAAQAFLDAGQLGYNLLGTLLKNADVDLSKRIKDLRAKIDERSYKLYAEAAGKREKIFSKPLDVDSLDDLKNVWTALATYSSVLQVKQQAFQVVSELKRTMANVDAANKRLKEIDGELKTDTNPPGLFRAGLLIARAEALKLVLRDKDVLGAAQEAEVCSGKKGRLTPTALRIEIEAYQRLNDNESLRNTCRKILSDYPRSMETHVAHQSMLDSFIREKRFDDAIRELKEYQAAFPIDEEVQQSISATLSALMDQEHDYKRVADLAEWALSALPLERVEVDIPKCYGGCNEYVLKDFTKAERGYAMLHEFFPDAIDPKDVEKVMGRLKLKAAGRFPKEPAETDDGPAGALAGFLRAVRTKDPKALELFVPNEEADEFKDQLLEPGDSLVPLLTFSDVIVRNIEYSPKKDSATMFLDIFPSAGNQPRPALQFAFNEGGKWKIRWRNLPDANAPVVTPPIDATAPPPAKPTEATVEPPPPQTTAPKQEK